MLSSWIDLDLEVVSEPEVFFFVSVIITFAVIHESNCLFGITDLMKRGGKILNAGVLLFTVLDRPGIELQCFKEITFFSFSPFGLFIVICGLTFLDCSFVVEVVEVSLEGIFEGSDDGVDLRSRFRVIGHIYKAK